MHKRFDFEGEGKGGHEAVEAPDTLFSNNIARIVDLLGEGEIEGLVGDTDDEKKQSIFYNEVPLRGPNGEWNFSGVEVVGNNGTPDQPALPGMDDVSTTIPVSQDLPFNVNKTISFPNDGSVTAVVVTISTNNFFEVEKDGDQVGTYCTFIIERSQNGGSFEVVYDGMIRGKQKDEFTIDYRIPITDPTGNTAIRVHRSKTDFNSLKINDAISFKSYTRIVEHRLSYPNMAVVGHTIDAKQFGGQIPQRQYRVRGLKCRVPHNYNAATRQYTGPFNGTMTTTKVYTNNPVLLAHEIITNKRLGLGKFFPETFQDLPSLYQTAKWCDELVPDGRGGMEPRWTCNTVINTRGEAFNVLKELISCFRGLFFWMQAKLWTFGDQPRVPSKLVTNANVMGGQFTYTGESDGSRVSAINVSFNDPEMLFRRSIETVEDPDLIREIGFKTKDFGAFGASSRSQARRMGRAILFAQEFESELVSYQASFDHMATSSTGPDSIAPGDLVLIADRARGNAVAGGLVVRLNSGKVVLDRPTGTGTGRLYVEHGDGSVEWLECTYQDGTAMVRNEVQTVGLVTLTQTPVKPVAATDRYILIASGYDPEPFVVLKVTRDAPNLIGVSAIRYEEARYAYIYEDIKIDPAKYMTLPKADVCQPVSDIIAEDGYVTGVDVYQRVINVSWTKSPDAYLSHNVVEYSRDNNDWQRLPIASGNTAQIPDAKSANYRIRVMAVNRAGVYSRPVVIEKNLGVVPANETLSVGYISDLTVNGGSGGTFNGRDARFSWKVNTPQSAYLQEAGVNPGTNIEGIADPLFLDCVVTIRDANNIVVREESVADTSYIYTLEKNGADRGGIPSRNFTFSVQYRDKFNRRSAPITRNISNPVPVWGVQPVATASLENVIVRVTPPLDPDYNGFSVYMKTTPGSVYLPANLKSKGNAGQTTIPAEPRQAHYVVVVPSDAYGEGGPSSEIYVAPSDYLYSYEQAVAAAQDAIEELQGAVGGDFTAINQAITELQQSASDQLQAIGDLQSTQSTTSQAVAGLTTDLNLAEQGILALGSTYDALEIRVYSTEGSVTTIQQTLTTVNGSISTLGQTVSSQNGTISNLSQTVSTQGQSISSALQSIQSQGGQITTLGQTVTNQGQTLSTLNTLVTASSSPNLLKNGGFENRLKGWTAGGSASSSWTYGFWSWGTYAINYAAVTGASPGGSFVFIYSDRIPAAQSANFTLSGDYDLQGTGTPKAYLQLNWYDINDQQISAVGGPQVGIRYFDQSGNLRTKFTAQSPANAQYVRVYLVAWAPAGSTISSIAWRQVKLDFGTLATPYSGEATAGQAYEAYSDLNGSVATLTQTVTTQGGSITTIQQSISNQNGTISGIQQTINSQGGTITTLSQVQSTQTGQIASINGRINLGGNLLQNTEFGYDSLGWNTYSDTPGSWWTYVRDGAGDLWRPYNEHNLAIYQGNDDASISALWSSDFFPVDASKYYEVSAYMAAHRCFAHLAISWKNASDAYINESTTSRIDAFPGWYSIGGGGQNIANWIRVWGKFQPPSGAVKAQFVARKFGTTHVAPWTADATQNSWMWFCRPQVVEVLQNTGGPTAYNPGKTGVSINQQAYAVNTLTTSYGSLSQTVSTQGGTINTTAQSLSNLTGTVNTLSQTVSGQGVSISTQGQTISTEQGKLATLTTRVDAGSNPNLIKNGGFENAFANWYSPLTMNTGVSNTWGNVADILFGTQIDYFYLQPAAAIPCWADTWHTFAFDAVVSASGGSGQLAYSELHWINSVGQTITVSYGPTRGSNFGFSGDGSTRKTLINTAKSPSSAVSVVPRIVYFRGSNTSNYFGVKQCKFEIGTVATSYSSEASIAQTFTTLSTNAQQLSSLQQTVSTRGGQVDQLLISVYDASGSFNQLTQTVSGINGRVQTLQGSYDTLNGSYNTLSQTVSSQGTSVNLLLTTVRDAQGNVAKAVLRAEADGSIAGVYLTASNTDISKIGFRAGKTEFRGASGNLLATLSEEGGLVYIPNLLVDRLRLGTTGSVGATLSVGTAGSTQGNSSVPTTDADWQYVVDNYPVVLARPATITMQLYSQLSYSSPADAGLDVFIDGTNSRCGTAASTAQTPPGLYGGGTISLPAGTHYLTIRFRGMYGVTLVNANLIYTVTY